MKKIEIQVTNEDYRRIMRNWRRDRKYYRESSYDDYHDPIPKKEQAKLEYSLSDYIRNLVCNTRPEDETNNGMPHWLCHKYHQKSCSIRDFCKEDSLGRLPAWMIPLKCHMDGFETDSAVEWIKHLEQPINQNDYETYKKIRMKEMDDLVRPVLGSDFVTFLHNQHETKD